MGRSKAATKTAALYENENEDENSLRLYDNEDMQSVHEDENR